jgi:large subunit ribosomal protein L5
MAENKNTDAAVAEKKAKAAEAAAKKKAAAEAKKSGGESVPPPKGYVPRLKKIYREKTAPELFKEFSYTSTMQVPRFVKVIVSMGVGEAKENKKILDAAVEDLAQITGQHAVKTKAKKSIATFKIRQGQEIGARVTLRGAMMWEFLDRLMNVALPRVKDFRGVNPNAFDGHGNYSLGLTEQIIFPEIDFDKIEKIMGLNIAIVTTARNDKEAKSLLAKMGMPFRK